MIGLMALFVVAGSESILRLIFSWVMQRSGRVDVGKDALDRVLRQAIWVLDRRRLHLQHEAEESGPAVRRLLDEEIVELQRARSVLLVKAQNLQGIPADGWFAFSQDAFRSLAAAASIPRNSVRKAGRISSTRAGS